MGEADAADAGLRRFARVGHHPHDAAAKCAGLADAYRDVAAALACPFLDAGAVVSARRVDGVHLDADQHAILGAALADVVQPVLSAYR